MDPYTLQDSSQGPSGSPVRRKMRSKNGTSRHSPQDPVLELMMFSLMERQSTSNSGGVNKQQQCLQPPECVTTVTQPAQACGAGGVPAGNTSSCCFKLGRHPWVRVTLFIFVLAAVVLAIALPLGLNRTAAAAADKAKMQPPQQSLGPRLNTSGMALVFADDFTHFDGDTWNVEMGDGSDYGLDSWGNREEQCYSTSPNNLDVMPHPDYPEIDGVLRIRPVFSSTPQPCINRVAPSSTRQWTSAKIDTKNKIAFTWAGPQVYKGPFSAAAAAASGRNAPGTAPAGSGRRALLAPAAASSTNDSSMANSTCGFVVMESRMKLPLAAGRWSALWAMPLPQPCPSSSKAAECGAFGGWPASGEIDIMEQVNADAQVLGTIHYADRLGFHQHLGGSMALAPAALLDWNIYQLVWDCRSITWYVNTVQVHQVTKQQLGSAVWPFDEPFFLILNTAVGGWLTGGVAPDTSVSRPFLIDYVRVYAKAGS